MTITAQEMKELLNQHVSKSALGSRGDIVQVLKQIASKLDDIQTSSSQVSRSLGTRNSGGGSGGISQRMLSNAVAQTTGSPSRGGQGRPPDDPNDISRKVAMKDLANGFKNVSGGLGNFVAKIANAGTHIDGFGKVLGGFIAARAFGEWLDHSADQLRETYTVGQTFGGSLLNLNIAAADAALPLDKFSKVVGENAHQFGALGGSQGFMGLQKQVRANMAQFGMYGMSVDQVIEGYGTYMDTFTKYGEMDEGMKQRSIKSFQGLVAETTALSTLTGRNRKDMMEQIKSAANRDSFQARMFSLNKDQAQVTTENLNRVNAVFASIGSQTGGEFSNLLADSMSAGGAALSEMSGTFIQTGMTNVLGAFDGLAAKVKNGTATESDSAVVMGEFMSSVKGNLPFLETQAKLGDASAQKVIKMYGEQNQVLAKYNGDMNAYMKDVQEAKRIQEDQNKAMAPFTKLMNSWSDQISRITGVFKSGFFRAISGVSDKLGKLFIEDGGFDKVGKMAERVGDGLGTMISNLFGPMLDTDIDKVLSSIETGILTFADTMIKIIPVFVSLASAVGTLLGWIVKLVAGIEQGVEKIASFFGAGDGASKMIGVGVTGALLIVVKMMGGILIDGMKSIMLRGLQSVTGGIGPAAGGAARGAGGMVGRAGKMLGKGGVGGLVAAGAGMALSAAPDFKGKDTISSMLEYGGMGATIGSFFGPIGTLVGAGLGALLGAVIENWDDIKKGLGDIWSGVTDFFSGIWDWFKQADFLAPLKAVFAISPLGMLIANWDSVTSGFSNIFPGIASAMASAFAWVGNLDIGSLVKTAISSIPFPAGVGSAVVGVLDKVFPTKTATASASVAPQVSAPKPVVETGGTVAQATGTTVVASSGQSQADDYQRAMVENLQELRKILTEVNKNIIVLREYVG